MKRHSGITLVELLVSITILALAAAIALTVYEHSRRAFKLGENVTEQQQVVRVALDSISSDIRMAGFNSNPDGNRVRPDEQIEAAYDTAITLRADFDAEDPLNADLPEQTLGGAGAAFLAVSTGNDEIVSYVLAKSDGTSTGTLSFSADVGDTVRDGTIEDVDIGDVDLAQSDPPYTLYKLVLENDSSGCCGTSFARRSPVVDNVSSLRFRYFDRAGNLLTAPGGAETPAARATRSAIHRVAVEIEALSRDSDPNWRDPDDPNPSTRHFRKFNLSGEVTPPNLGREAIKDLRADVTAPSAPPSPSLYPGHCGGLIVNWTANAAQDEVAYYRVIYGTDPGPMTGVRSSKFPGVYVGGLSPSTPYQVAVEAVDAAGNRSPPSPIANTSTTNTTTPQPTLSLNAVAGTEKVDFDWASAVDNMAGTTGDPGSPMIRDLAGYRLYRSPIGPFTASSSTEIADETVLPPLASPVFTDTTVPACQTHYYKVKAVDHCGLTGQASDTVSAKTWTDADPFAPLDVQAFNWLPGKIWVVWSPVLENTDGPINVSKYKVYRTPLQPLGMGPLMWSQIAEVTGGTEYVDSISIPAGQTAHYLVRAVDTCTPPNMSVISDPGHPTCTFSGRVQIVEPAYGTKVWGPTTIRVEVQGANATATHVLAELTYTKVSNGTTVGPNTILGGSDWWEEAWDARPTGVPAGFFVEGSYILTAVVTQDFNAQTCTAQASIRVEIDN